MEKSADGNVCVTLRYVSTLFKVFNANKKSIKSANFKPLETWDGEANQIR